MNSYSQKLIIGFFLVSCLFSSAAAHSSDKGSADEAVALVKKAAAYLSANGKDKSFAEFNNPAGPFVIKDMYVFVYSMNGDGINLVHGANPKMVGKNLLELKDVDGVYIVKEFYKTANSKSGKGWVDYKWSNPVTKTFEAKTTYIEKVGDFMIGCGVYK
ncbi:cache domain-containing protein [Undibacterium sp.]|uniref:cache domain-containing protein n=1 Tax=Undibacterium sp. TaxID=1914977 RepID=UPI0025FBDA27|nr:cache domain-containing protein [Undibacterium sp.]